MSRSERTVFFFKANAKASAPFASITLPFRFKVRSPSLHSSPEAIACAPATLISFAVVQIMRKVPSVIPYFDLKLTRY